GSSPGGPAPRRRRAGRARRCPSRARGPRRRGAPRLRRHASAWCQSSHLFQGLSGHGAADASLAVLVDSRQSRELPFFPTLLCLWATGWVTSAVGALVVIHSAAPTGRSPVLLAVNLVLSSAIGAVVARQLLLELVGCELSYSAILLSLVAGSVVIKVARRAVFAGLRHSGSPAFPVAGIGV